LSGSHAAVRTNNTMRVSGVSMSIHPMPEVILPLHLADS
jgi:hypothetical protein